MTETTLAETTEDTGAEPWEGIPAELLTAPGGYDTDTAGGCG